MKFNKILIIFICCLFAINITGCHKKEEASTKEPEKVFYNVEFKNYDGTILYSTKVEEGQKVEYKGPEPTKPDTDRLTYKFSNWDFSLDLPVNGDLEIFAEYKSTVKKFKVTFLDYDGSVLLKVFIEYGEHAYFTNLNPTRTSDDEHIEYKFNGWDKSPQLTTIYEDTEFKASYREIKYNIAKFYDEDGSLLYTSKVEEGEIPTFSGKTPTKKYEGTENKTYKFVGWDKSLEPISKDTEYRPKFELKNIYIVTFKNYDGEILSTVNVCEGDDVEYNGRTPYKEGYKSGKYTYTYTFNGWDGSLKNITCDMVLTATFKENVEYERTGKEKIAYYLQTHGYGEFNLVSTGRDSSLGYEDGLFYIDYIHEEGSIECQFAASFCYGSSIGTGVFKVYYNGMKAFEVSITIHTSGHYFSNLSNAHISYNILPSDVMENVANLTFISAREAVNNATNYLENHNLGYIW